MKSALYLLILFGGLLAAPQNTADLQAIIQKCVDLPRLQPYYNIDRFPEERKPLIIMKNAAIKGGLQVTKFGVPVSFLTHDEIWQKNTNAYIEFFRLNIVKDTAFVKFQYKIEGIQLEVRFEKVNGQWEVKKEKII